MMADLKPTHELWHEGNGGNGGRNFNRRYCCFYFFDKRTLMRVMKTIMLVETFIQTVPCQRHAYFLLKNTKHCDAGIRLFCKGATSTRIPVDLFPVNAWVKRLIDS